MTVLWCPFAARDLVRSGAGTFTTGHPKIVHHTTEGATYAGARAAYATTGSLPHFTDSIEGGTYRAWQHLPVDQAATALRHPAHTPDTNRAHAIQIEHVGTAARSYLWPLVYLAGIARLCRWIESECHVPRVAPFPFPYRRLSWAEWGDTAGHLGHLHVPGNDHHDPGAIDIARILDLPPAVIPPEEPEMLIIAPPGGNLYLLAQGKLSYIAGPSDLAGLVAAGIKTVPVTKEEWGVLTRAYGEPVV